VADPGHLNLGSTETESKASQERRDFEFLQLNMHRSKGGSFNLRRSLDGGQIDVALLEEPWIYILQEPSKGIEIQTRVNICRNQG
jgi:ABC-type Na+ transport system ATPase subunit NatA